MRDLTVSSPMAAAAAARSPRSRRWTPRARALFPLSPTRLSTPPARPEPWPAADATWRSPRSADVESSAPAFAAAGQSGSARIHHDHEDRPNSPPWPAQSHNDATPRPYDPEAPVHTRQRSPTSLPHYEAGQSDPDEHSSHTQFTPSKTETKVSPQADTEGAVSPGRARCRIGQECDIAWAGSLPNRPGVRSAQPGRAQTGPAQWSAQLGQLNACRSLLPRQREGQRDSGREGGTAGTAPQRSAR